MKESSWSYISSQLVADSSHVSVIQQTSSQIDLLWPISVLMDVCFIIVVGMVSLATEQRDFHKLSLV